MSHSRLGPVTPPGGRRGRGPVGGRAIRRRFLIVCEGEVTETRYFEAFPVSADVQVAVRGEGKNTKSLVRTAREHAKAGAMAGAA